VLDAPNTPPVASIVISASPLTGKNSVAWMLTDSGDEARAVVAVAEIDANKPRTKHPRIP
jgi:hypothetical protein